ncbi:class I SAM-dependent DNA methyltransferase [Indiicoccus explosivorum]|uniref:class I SAM-dependent DNA methyltransferase n=1 Tax=Indiicoccus explosivorum TaxID=1917864 RepID=UPI000B442BFE|nr:class I SAM-dependent methyltransferase [Indiicoccus explosivorum]
MMYGKFAAVYDDLMADIPYLDYARWVKQHAGGGRLLEAASGTGVLTALLAEEGFEVTATDLSEEMLSVAGGRFSDRGLSIPLFAVPMTELHPFTGFDAAVIAIDSLNYLPGEQEVRRTFEGIHRALNKGGQLFFDVHSVYKLEEVFADGPFVYDGEDMAYIWHTEKGDAELSVIHYLTFFVRQGQLFERFEEQHRQRTFPTDFYVRTLKEAGFRQVEVSGGFTGEAPRDLDERIFFRAIK